MADASVYAGLAAGADYAARQLENKRKEALEERLMRQRAELQNEFDEARAARAEAREAKKVAKEEIIQDANGNFVRRATNSFGDVLREAPASQMEIDAVNVQRDKDKVALDSARLGMAVNQFKLEHAAEDFALDQEVKRANIDQSRASAEASRAAARKRDSESDDAETNPTLDDAVQELVKDYQGLVEGYVKGDNPTMSAQEVYDVARSSIKEAAKRGKAVGSTFQNALKAYVEQNAGSTGSGFQVN